jgi:threonine dehydrogenase-like Zn-dependent dehydrogenase
MHRYEEKIDDLIGGLTETMANAIYCASRAELRGNESILILGMGSIGACLNHYLLRTFPDLRITVVTSSPEKLQLLKALDVKGITESDLTIINDEFDVVFETSGFEEYLLACIPALKPRGTLMIYGVFKSRIHFDFNQVSEFKELKILGGHLADDSSFDKAVAFLSKYQNELKYLISRIVNFSNFRSAFDGNDHPKFKTMFQPTGGVE